MDRAVLEQHLAEADLRVTQSERHVCWQRGIVDGLAKDGHDTSASRILLREFEHWLVVHTTHRDRLRLELTALPVAPV
ncbi:MAG TPA: hypothetical protein VFO44_02625 [Steroidobacteraceae bacterium]|nr:hypothetical protein [Steroidobacteraceae bacterium]